MNFASSTIAYLDVHEGSMLVISTVVLIGVTAVYALQTWKLSKLASKQRVDNVLPVIISERFTTHEEIHEDEKVVCVHAFLKNIGNGPAFNIRIKFFDAETKKLLTPNVTTIAYLAKSISSEEQLHIPKEAFESVRYHVEDGKMLAALRIEIAFHDIFNNHHVIRQRFTLIKTTGEMRQPLGAIDFDFAD